MYKIYWYSISIKTDYIQSIKYFNIFFSRKILIIWSIYFREYPQPPRDYVSCMIIDTRWAIDILPCTSVSSEKECPSITQVILRTLSPCRHPISDDFFSQSNILRPLCRAEKLRSSFDGTPETKEEK